MQPKILLPATLLPLALVLSGCGTGLISTGSINADSASISGKSFGGQSPIVGATINIYAAGRTGYGSDATLLASTTTDSSGNFSFPANAYTCPSPNAPVYILSIGGNTGAGVNSNAVNGVGIGPCSVAPSTYVVMNEVTTVALAYSLSHFFTTTLGTGSTDSFGGPGVNSVDYSPGITNAMFNQVHHMVNINYGGVNAPPNGSIESAKIYTIANILAACVNTIGTTSPTDIRSTCGKLFRYTTPSGGGTRPSDTLQAAVQMALYPAQNVNNLFALAPATPAFAGGLTATPNDWTIGMSFTAPNLGLAVDSGSVSTIDIDTSGRIWFPSNAASATGVAYFDPATEAFTGPYNGTSMVHPQQVAIDGYGSAWLNDNQSAVVSSYNTASPNTFTSFSLSLTSTNSVTIGYDDSVAFGLQQYSSGTFAVSKVSADHSSYALVPNTSSIYPYTSIAGDPVGGEALVAENLPSTRLLASYLNPPPTGGTTSVLAANDNTGQVIFTGNDFVSVRSYAGTGNANDGLCIFSQQACFGLKGGLRLSPIGMVIDGAGALWLADSAGASVQAVFPQSTGTNGMVYLNTNNVAPNNIYLHGPDNGGTMVTPYGIAVDNSGNVWVSNAGCTTTTCTPGSFVLSEIIGAATPTITPVSVQILGNTTLTGTRP